MESIAELTERMRRVERQGDYVKMIYCAAKSTFTRQRPIEIALAEFPRNERIKTAVAAMSAASGGAGASLASAAFPQQSGEWVSLLSSQSLTTKLNLPRVNANTRTIFETTPASATFIAHGDPIPVSVMALDAATLVPQHKIAGICVFTEESLQVWNSATAALLNRSLTRAISRGVDAALMDPASSAIADARPASITNAGTSVVSTGTTSAAIDTDLKNLIAVFTNAGNELDNAVFVTTPTTAVYLASLLTAGNVRAHPNVGAKGGEIFGIPVFTSSGSVASGSPNERVLALVNTAAIALYDDGQTDITASRETILAQDTAPSVPSNAVSVFTSSSVAIRFMRWLSWKVASATAVAYLRIGY